ncbi:hypothetical protein [Dyella sp. A6]|uniref:hypothetical protein n=1 Tax=Dyella aluminiiresistens TaxID=3069105 RepID=UPI002E79F69B|nr:hypothetical protein [Dyella sp. A6]
MKIALPLLCVTALAACSGKPPAPRTETASQAHAASTSAPWDAMTRDEQRARDVQTLVNKQAARQNKQIEQQTQ